VRSGGVGQTALDFTGQRRDGTGLLYYGARYYDLRLGRFLSADTIAPRKELPQSRNRYSHVLNNPLKYVDPSGHCESANPSAGLDEQQRIQRENGRCYRYINELQEYGVNVALEFFTNWRSSELAQVLEAIGDWMRVAGWDDPGYVKGALGGGVMLIRQHGNGRSWETGATIWLYDPVFYSGAAYAKYTVVHERAQRWDEASAWLGFFGGHSQGLLNATGSWQSWRCEPGTNCTASGRYRQGDVDRRPGQYSGENRWEDFAESVASTVYPATTAHRGTATSSSCSLRHAGDKDRVSAEARCFASMLARRVAPTPARAAGGRIVGCLRATAERELA